MERENNGGSPTPSSFLGRTINASSVSSLAASLQGKPVISELVATSASTSWYKCAMFFSLLSRTLQSSSGALRFLQIMGIEDELWMLVRIESG